MDTVFLGVEDTRDCPAGYTCVDGSCIQTCSTDKDCPKGYICVDGQCVRDPDDVPPMVEMVVVMVVLVSAPFQLVL